MNRNYDSYMCRGMYNLVGRQVKDLFNGQKIVDRECMVTYSIDTGVIKSVTFVRGYVSLGDNESCLVFSHAGSLLNHVKRQKTKETPVIKPVNPVKKKTDVLSYIACAAIFIISGYLML